MIETTRIHQHIHILHLADLASSDREAKCSVQPRRFRWWRSLWCCEIFEGGSLGSGCCEREQGERSLWWRLSKNGGYPWIPYMVIKKEEHDDHEWSTMGFWEDPIFRQTFFCSYNRQSCTELDTHLGEQAPLGVERVDPDWSATSIRLVCQSKNRWLLDGNPHVSWYSNVSLTDGVELQCIDDVNILLMTGISQRQFLNINDTVWMDFAT